LVGGPKCSAPVSASSSRAAAERHMRQRPVLERPVRHRHLPMGDLHSVHVVRLMGRKHKSASIVSGRGDPGAYGISAARSVESTSQGADCPVRAPIRNELRTELGLLPKGQIFA
jgi:hypothetical protein